MKKNNIVILVIILLIIWVIYNSRSKPKFKSQTSNGAISGCTNPIATNYDPMATIEDGSCILGYQGCCDTSASNYDASCESDPACQCSQQECNILSGRSACCDSTTLEYDPTCLGDSNCYCDQSLCGQTTTGGRTACCQAGSTNYDATCSGDPFCSCDNSICQQPTQAHTCYSNCIGTGFQSLLTTEPCGSGYASNYPNEYAPYCATTQD